VYCSGQVPARAEYNYLDRVRWLDMYGVVLHPVKVQVQIGYLSSLDTRLGDVLDLNGTSIRCTFARISWQNLLKL